MICAANCTFRNAGDNCSQTACGALEIGADATTAASVLTPVIAQFNQGVFASSPDYDIMFDSSNNVPCNCRVAVGGGMLDVENGVGVPSTNAHPELMLGQTSYAPPTFGNAASIGIPLTLNPNELGIGVSTDTETAPKGSGVKLRVECATNRQGKVRILLLTGTSSNPITLFDNIGDAGSVSACN